MLKKLWTIGWKDTRVRLADRGALLFLLLTPIALTMLLGAVFGGGDDGDFVPPPAPLALINHDEGPLGVQLVTLLQQEPALMALVTASVQQDEAAARGALERGEGPCCLLIIPEAFSAAVEAGEPVALGLYMDPAQPLSAALVEGIAQQLAGQFAARSLAINVAIQQLSATGRLRGPAEAQALAAAAPDRSDSLRLSTVNASGESVRFDPLAYIAPGIALLFLSFGVVQGARSLLEEEESGTLARLSATPTSAMAILGGKVVGIFLASLLQFGALMLGTVFLFSVRWGEPLAVLVLSLVLVLTFTCLGLALSVIGRSEAQVNTLGTIVSLIFALLGGSLISRNSMPLWLRQVGLVTPNAWGMDAFTKLGQGQGLAEIVPQLVGLLLMGAALFAFSLLRYQKRVAA